MLDVILSVIVVLIVISLLLFILWKSTRKQLKLAEMKIEELDYAVKALKAENSVFKEISEQLNKNRRVADEKIEELHNGDSVANAIDGLCKH